MKDLNETLQKQLDVNKELIHKVGDLYMQNSKTTVENNQLKAEINQLKALVKLLQHQIEMNRK